MSTRRAPRNALNSSRTLISQPEAGIELYLDARANNTVQIVSVPRRLMAFSATRHKMGETLCLTFASRYTRLEQNSAQQVECGVHLCLEGVLLSVCSVPSSDRPTENRLVGDTPRRSVAHGEQAAES